MRDDFESRHAQRVESLAARLRDEPEVNVQAFYAAMLRDAAPGTEPIIANLIVEADASRRAHRTMRLHGWDRCSQK